MNEWRKQEEVRESQLSSVRGPISAGHVLTVERIFELANHAHFLLPYAEFGGAWTVVEIGSFELRNGWRKSLPDIQKAIRSDFPAGEK